MSDTQDNPEPTPPEPPAKKRGSPRPWVKNQAEALADLEKNGCAAIGDSPGDHPTFAIRSELSAKVRKKYRNPAKVIEKLAFKITGVKIGKIRYNCVFDGAVQVLIDSMGEKNPETGCPTELAVRSAVKFIDLVCPAPKNIVSNVNNIGVDVTIEAMQRVQAGLASGEVRDIFKANAQPPALVPFQPDGPVVEFPNTPRFNGMNGNGVNGHH